MQTNRTQLTTWANKQAGDAEREITSSRINWVRVGNEKRKEEEEEEDEKEAEEEEEEEEEKKLPWMETSHIKGISHKRS